MRYYLDTNILIFLLMREKNDIHYSIRSILEDCSNLFYISSAVLQEVIFLLRIGKLKSKIYKSEKDILDFLDNFGIEIVVFNDIHLKKYLNLTVVDEHKDMNDHAIIAQAISDKMTLISSDHDFKNYIPQGLNFVFNKR